MTSKIRVLVLVAAVVTVAASSAAATTVLPTTPIPTSLGFFTAGNYHIATTGIVSLAGPVGGGATDNFDLDPDGIPVTGVTYSNYLYFNPNGSDTADGNHGPGGAGINIGALMGTFTATPSSPSDWFLIGSSLLITLATDQEIYAALNDTFYDNNEGSFDVNVAAVPLPAALPVFATASAMMGLAGWRRKRAAAV